MNDPWVNYAHVMVMLLASVGLLFASSARAVRHPGRLTACFSLLAVLAIWSYSGFGAFHRPHYGFVHGWDMFHYHVASKYFPELGYDGLYAAVLQADAQLPEPRLRKVRWVREPKSYELLHAREMRRNPRFIEKFSEARWDAFLGDVAYFESLIPSHLWKWFFRDHGYNAPPSRTAVTGPIASMLGDANDVSVLAIALIDPLLLVVLVIAIFRAYGLRTASLAVIVFGTSKLASFSWIGGSFTRFDWFVLTGLGVIALETRRNFLAGALIGAAAMLRLFPAFFALGVILRGLYKLFRTRSFDASYARFAAGLVAAGAGLFLLSLFAGGGLTAWTEFTQKILRHAEGQYANHVGILAVVGDSTALLWLARAGIVGLYLAALARVDDVQAALLGGVLIFSFGFIAGYYYSFLALFWLWQRDVRLDRSAVAFYVLLFLPSAVIISLEDSARLTMLREHYAASVALVFTFGALFWWIFGGRRRLAAEKAHPGPLDGVRRIPPSEIRSRSCTFASWLLAKLAEPIAAEGWTREEE